MGCVFGKPPTEEDGDGATEVPAKRVVAPPVVPSYVAAAPGGSATWPIWLTEVAGEAIRGWVPRRAESFQMLGKIGQGTYSNVYKARDMETGKMVALKKVRFESLERESVKFMAREISILRRLDHPNVIKLQGMVISRVSTSLYLVFDYLEHDLSGLLSSPEVHFSLPQIKSFLKQLLSGLEHCHSQGVMHRDIKGANLLLGNDGVLKIADFGLALHRRFGDQRRMTSRVVTLWYRPPELLLGSTSYGFGVDLWSAGCVLGELLCGRPILPGRTEVEQLHKIFKLCGSPGEDYCRKLRLPKMAAVFNTEPPYPSSIAQTFHHFPPSALSLITKLLSLDPSNRGTATSALNSEFFSESPESCEMSLAHYRPTKELDAKMRDELARGKSKESKEKGAAPRKPCPQSRRRARPAPEANAELQINIDRRRLIAQMAAKSKSEKFPPPHRDGYAGIRPEEEQPRNQHLSFVARPERSFESSLFDPKNLPECAFPTPAAELCKKKQETTNQLARGTIRRRIKPVKTDSQVAPAQMYVSAEFNKDLGRLRVDGRFKGKEIKASS